MSCVRFILLDSLLSNMRVQVVRLDSRRSWEKDFYRICLPVCNQTERQTILSVQKCRLINAHYPLVSCAFIGDAKEAPPYPASLGARISKGSVTSLPRYTQLSMVIERSVVSFHGFALTETRFS